MRAAHPQHGSGHTFICENHMLLLEHLAIMRWGGATSSPGASVHARTHIMHIPTTMRQQDNETNLL